jgi:PIN domain nuclease of toxin-antitoxin system
VKLLLDTNIVIQWLAEPRKLSKNQLSVLEDSMMRQDVVAVSAITLIEIALLFTDNRSLRPQSTTVEELLGGLQSNRIFQILPLSFDIAREVLKIGKTFRDPADRVITATALVHGLRLLTSDQQIVDSGLVPTID